MKADRKLAIRNLETLARQFATRGMRIDPPLKHVLIEHDARHGEPTYQAMESLGRDLQPPVTPFPFSVKNPKPGQPEAVFRPVLPIGIHDSYRPGFKCHWWIPLPIVRRKFAGIPEEIDYDAASEAWEKLRDLKQEAYEHLQHLLPICGITEDFRKIRGNDWWFFVVHIITDTKPRNLIGENYPVRVIEDIFLASELAINKILESVESPGPPPEICSRLTETELGLFLSLWTRPVATFDQLISDVWNGEAVQDGTVSKRLRCLGDKLLNTECSLTITGRNAILTKLDN